MVAVVEQLRLEQVVQMSGVRHFMMLEDPQTFNRLLDDAVQTCLHARAQE
jgi:hypothetical protein